MAAAYPPGPPITPVPTEQEYDMIIDDLIRDGWGADNWDREYDWGNGVPPPLFHQNAMTDYERVRKPNGRWLLLSRRRPDPPPPPINPNPGQGGRKRHKQKKSKKNKHSRKRRRTRKHCK
jgi:hypothetical protein